MPNIKKFINDNRLSIAAFITTGAILGIVQVKVSLKPILLERFIPGWGWAEIVLLSVYASFIIYKMKDPARVAFWRRVTWTVFSGVFFAQLIGGLFGIERLLMTGELHFPIPGLIILGPLYRMKITFMPILFFSTVILSGPAWCSHLCYFGGLDNLAASSGNKKNRPVRYKSLIRHAVLGFSVPFSLALRLLHVPVLYAIISASTFGIAGALIVAFITTGKNKMIHCITYCPVGTAVQYLKYLSPFRLYIDKECNNCMKCSAYCRYDALGAEEIKNLRPGMSCTLCGDCLVSCRRGAIGYRFFNLPSGKARNLYLVISISLHAVFLGLARI